MSIIYAILYKKERNAVIKIVVCHKIQGNEAEIRQNLLANIIQYIPEVKPQKLLFTKRPECIFMLIMRKMGYLNPFQVKMNNNTGICYDRVVQFTGLIYFGPRSYIIM